MKKRCDYCHKAPVDEKVEKQDGKEFCSWLCLGLYEYDKCKDKAPAS